MAGSGKQPDHRQCSDNGRSRRGRRLLAVAAAVTLAVTGCASQQTVQAGRHAASLSNLPASQTEFRTVIQSWTTYSFNPYGAAGYLTAFQNGFDYVRIPLAYVRLLPGKGKYGGFYRELASGWTIAGRTLTIDLRPDAKWDNGTPFTSRDVLVSMEVAGAELNGMWSSISRVSTPSPHRVVIDLAPSAVAENVLLDLTQMPILPASQYKQFAPAGVQDDILTYWRLEDPLHPSAASQAAATKSAADKALQKIATALPKYNPPTLLGDGPYKLTSISTNAMLLTKWDGFWDAKAITIPRVYVEGLDLASQYGALLSGRFDWVTDEELTDPQAEKLDAVPHQKYVTLHAPINQFGLAFNQTDYPFNLRGVRQALAYVLDRPKFNRLNWGGTLIQNPTVRYEDDLPYALNTQYLTAGQLKTLNRYAYSPKKAASLLQGLGFTKRSGTWYTPKGQPFKITVDAPADSGNDAQQAIILANMMKSFGIEADTDLIANTTFATDQEDGDYAVSISENSDGFVNPLQYYQWTFVTFAKEDGIPATADVPGLGNVPVASTLNREVATAKPKQWAKLVWDWARYANQQVPALGLDDNSFHSEYATTRWTDWPPVSDHSLWTAWAPQPIVFMENGYLKFTKG